MTKKQDEINAIYHAMRLIRHKVDISVIKSKDVSSKTVSFLSREELKRAIQIIEKIQKEEGLPINTLSNQKTKRYLLRLAQSVQEAVKSDVVGVDLDETDIRRALVRLSLDCARERWERQRDYERQKRVESTKSHIFKVGQKVVYPNHGIGTIEQIEKKQIGATVLPFYTLRLAQTNTVVLVPVANAVEVGLRPPISTAECQALLEALSDKMSGIPHDMEGRFKEFNEKIRTGDIFEVADVLKKLTFMGTNRSLSFREQRLLERARYLIVSEMAVVRLKSEHNVEILVEEALAKLLAKHERKSIGFSFKNKDVSKRPT